ncbi:MAG: flavin reductase family protein [Bacteroidetes bacterium]|nr:flavin reductase family protein [Bacteroidota bacterium]
MMKHFSTEAIAAMEQRFRAQFINSAPGYKNLCLVGTRSAAGVNNLAVFNSLFHVGANPPLLGLVFRPDSVDRHTLMNIRETGFYTLNLVSEGMEAAAHQTSARYPSDVSEFDAVGLSPVFSGAFHAPAVAESPLRMGMKLEEEIHVALNGTSIVIGSICWLECAEQAIGEDGFVDPAHSKVITVCGLDAYYKTELKGRYAYAKPDKKPALLL